MKAEVMLARFGAADAAQFIGLDVKDRPDGQVIGMVTDAWVSGDGERIMGEVDIPDALWAPSSASPSIGPRA